MAEITMKVDAAVVVPVNIFPLTDDTDFKTRETAVAYNAAGMDLVWNFVTPAGVQTQTAVTPTTGGDYDWTHLGDGMYSIEIPASGGASINNDTEGYGWFTGVATGVLPWRGPIVQFSPANVVDSLVSGTDTLDVDASSLLDVTMPASPTEGNLADYIKRARWRAEQVAQMVMLMRHAVLWNVPSSAITLAYSGNVTGDASITLLLSGNAVGDVLETFPYAATAKPGDSTELTLGVYDATGWHPADPAVGDGAGGVLRLDVQPNTGTVTAGNLSLMWNNTELENIQFGPAVWNLAQVADVNTGEVRDASYMLGPSGEVRWDEYPGQHVIPHSKDNAVFADSTPTAQQVEDEIFGRAVEGTETFEHTIRIARAALVGKAAGGGTTAITFRDKADTKNRIAETVDANGNRTAVTTDGT